MIKKPTKRVLGKDLKVGDVMEVWWQPNYDTIIKLEPYYIYDVSHSNWLRNVFPNGAGFAYFSHYKVGMTIDFIEYYDIVCVDENSIGGFQDANHG